MRFRKLILTCFARLSLKSETGSVTLTSEALILAFIVLMGLAAVGFLLARTDEQMDRSSSWVSCGNVLDCEKSPASGQGSGETGGLDSRP